MKTIVEKTTKQSKYLFEDSKSLTMNSDSIIVGKDPVDFIVMDLNKDNTTLYEDVTDAPKDWIGCKYFVLQWCQKLLYLLAILHHLKIFHF